MVTIQMIADACGVSPSTVSKALNNSPTLRPGTAARIRRAAQEMGYVPEGAHTPGPGHSYCFGIIYEEAMKYGLNHDYFTRILNSFVSAAEAHGYDVFLLGEKLAGRAMSYTEHARYRNCDGILIISGTDSIARVADELRSLDKPVVCVDYRFEGFGSVLSDNEQGVRDLVNYVVGQGHRRVAFIHGNDSNVTRLRVDCFEQTCRALGLRVPREYIVPAAYYDARAAAEATRFLLNLSAPPTCILYPDDFAYMGGLNELNRRGLRVPGDISAAGYDGVDLSQAFNPKLTTLRQDSEALGAAAARMLVEAAESGPPFQMSSERIPGRLIEGETVRKV